MLLRIWPWEGSIAYINHRMATKFEPHKREVLPPFDFTHKIILEAALFMLEYLLFYFSVTHLISWSRQPLGQV